MLDESSHGAVSRLRGLRVLIVDDSWHLATTVKSRLEEVGMVIVGAVATAGDAVRLANELAPKVAVVDIKLRDGMAHGLIDQLHDLEVRVVVVTAFNALVTPPVKAGAILPKPFSGDELLAALLRTT